MALRIAGAVGLGLGGGADLPILRKGSLAPPNLEGLGVGARLLFGDPGVDQAVDESELVEQELVGHWPPYSSVEGEQGLSIRPKYLIVARAKLHLPRLCVTLRDDRPLIWPQATDNTSKFAIGNMSNGVPSYLR